MNQSAIYPKDWLSIHPYTSQQPSDKYFIDLSNQLYTVSISEELPVHFRKKLCTYTAAYLEDIISNLGLWNSFRQEHRRLYHTALPFYAVSTDYIDEEVNEEDIRFIIWNTWQKALYPHSYINPNDERIHRLSQSFYQILCKAYEEAPENDVLENYFQDFKDEKDADRKLTWLFGHTYLTEPSMQPYIERVTPKDRFIIPTGPLALFLHEWMDLLSKNASWKQIKGLYTPEPVIPLKTKEKNANTYQRFTSGNNGKHIAYLNGYSELRHFLTQILGWADDDEHTLPQMKNHRNFILMSNPEKGILLAKDICEYIADSANKLYNKEEAQKHAFCLLTEETVCPPDLLSYCIEHQLIPDAQLPVHGEQELVQRNADFIARHSLLYYYRGD